MKRLLLLLVGIVCIAGCSTKAVEDRLDAVGEKVGDGISKIMGSSSTTISSPKISRQDALDIALHHAGFSQNQVSELETEYEIDGHYDVQFRVNGREYEYEISASDGSIISFEVDE